MQTTDNPHSLPSLGHKLSKSYSFRAKIAETTRKVTGIWGKCGIFAGLIAKMTQNLQQYIHRFTHLKRAPQFGGAPHKPVLLLSICQMFSQGLLTQNRIPVTAELVYFFKTIWKQLVTTPHFPVLNMPFFHLQSEGFWHLHSWYGKESELSHCRDIGSINKLNEIVEYAYLDEALYELLTQPITNAALEHALLDKYFASTKALYYPKAFSTAVLNNIIINPANIQQEQIAVVAAEKAVIEEDNFARGNLFKTVVPRIYDYTCSISKLRLTSTVQNVSMVDACHIVPFSESHDDSIGNGIALCPNLHRAFDKGLIAISDDYTVLVNKHIAEDKTSAFNLSQFAGQPLKLPYSEELYPTLENIGAHRKRWGY